MLNDIASKIGNNRWKTVLFLAVFFIGIYLRTYNFSKWLHFEIDQAYDISIVSNAVEHSLFELPLLGPTAAGSRTLRLGPAYYYLEYLSAKVFGNTPPGHAAFVLIFGILAMPLFYIFARRYFSFPISFVLMIIFSVSLYMVIYSRFSWNPNVLPFLTLLAFYALLRSVSKDEKKSEIWLYVSTAAIAVATQAHYNAFFIIPVAAISFLIIKWPRFKFKTWLFVLLIIFAVYSPVILSDIKTGGQNTRYFWEQLQGGKVQHSALSLGEKTVQTFQYSASEYFLILTGIDHINNNERMNGFGFRADDNLPWRIAALIFLAASLAVILINLKKEKESGRKDFLLLSLVLFLASILYFFALQGSYIIYSRFFLEVSILPFVFFGLILEKLSFKKFGRFKFIIPVVLIFFIILTNARGLEIFFSQLKKVDSEPLAVSIEDVFPNTARVTLGQEYAIVNYIESKARQNGYPVYLSASNEYIENLGYLLEKDGIIYRKQIENTAIYAEGNYFVIPYFKKGIEGYVGRFNVIEEKNFGALDVFNLAPKSEVITLEKENSTQAEMSLQKEQIASMLTWKKLFK